MSDQDQPTPGQSAEERDEALAPDTLYSYSAKFVCGLADPDEGEGIVRPGVYSTEINIHNYHDVEVAVRKNVLPLVFDGKARGREPELVGVEAQDGIVLPPNTATFDDCCGSPSCCTAVSRRNRYP